MWRRIILTIRCMLDVMLYLPKIHWILAFIFNTYTPGVVNQGYMYPQGFLGRPPRGYAQMGRDGVLPPTTLSRYLPGAGPGRAKGSSALMWAAQALPSQLDVGVGEACMRQQRHHPPPHSASTPCPATCHPSPPLCA